MSDRMADVIETGMVLRRLDIEDGRKLERDRIIALLEEVQSVEEALAILKDGS
jgi:hypothetical protein